MNVRQWYLRDSLNFVRYLGILNRLRIREWKVISILKIIQATDVIFPNGSDDPWFALGVLEANGNDVIFIDGKILKFFYKFSLTSIFWILMSPLCDFCSSSFVLKEFWIEQLISLFIASSGGRLKRLDKRKLRLYFSIFFLNLNTTLKYKGIASIRRYVHCDEGGGGR